MNSSVILPISSASIWHALHWAWLSLHSGVRRELSRLSIRLIYPAQEAEADYFDHAINSGNESQKLTGKAFRNNPEMNRQLYLILEYFARLFPTSEDYAARFQDILLKTWTDPNSDNISDILIEAMGLIQTGMSYCLT